MTNPFCPHCLSSETAHAGRVIIVKDQQPQFDESDTAEEWRCQKCGMGFYLHRNATSAVPTNLKLHLAVHQHEYGVTGYPFQTATDLISLTETAWSEDIPEEVETLLQALSTTLGMDFEAENGESVIVFEVDDFPVINLDDASKS